MISQTSEYALRAIVHLSRNGGEESMTTQDIAAATKVPSGYLSKVLQALARAGLVSSQRGLGGGFSLARPPSQISLLDVVQAVDSPLERITVCPLGLKSHRRLCPLHRKLDDTIAIVEEAFGSTMITDVIGTDPEVEPLCESPQEATISARKRGGDDKPPAKSSKKTTRKKSRKTS